MKTPSARFRLSPRQWHPADARSVYALRNLVPGAFVYPKEEEGRPPPNPTDVYVAIHGAYLVQRWLDSWGIGYQYIARDGAETIVFPWQATEGSVVAAFERAAVVLSPTMVAKTTPYQRRIPWHAGNMPYLWLDWPTGTGKTVGAMLAVAAAPPGVVVIVTPSTPKWTWQEQFEQHTRFRPFVLAPKSERKMGSRDLAEYIEEQREAVHRAAPGWEAACRPIVLVGLELLSDYADELIEVTRKMGSNNSISTVVFDEIHLFGDHQRHVKKRRAPDGSCPKCGAEPGKPCIRGCTGTAYVARKTAAGADVESRAAGRERRSVAAETLSRLDSIRLRVGMAAIRFDEGRPRRYWGPFDLIDPFGLGSYWSYATRYCNAHKPEDGWGWDDTGESHLDELADRAAYFTDSVSYSEARKYLPPLRVQVVHIPVGSQHVTTDPGTRDYLKEASREARMASSKEVGQGIVANARLAVACARCRPTVVDDIVSVVTKGGKAHYFSGWQQDAERTAAAIRRALPESIPVYCGHGGTPEGERKRMLASYRNGGSAVLCGTGDAWGLGLDGLQVSNLACIPLCKSNPTTIMQWMGRSDRMGGVGTLVRLYVADGTRMEAASFELVRRVGNLGAFMEGHILSGHEDEIKGMADDTALEAAIVAKILSKGKQEEDEEREDSEYAD